tara:strand:- start:2152 stop:3567 length:1416 start_codon:yes stop_codon:yes gene_type:complete
MINGCQNTTKKLIVENELLLETLKSNKTSIENQKDLKSTIPKSEIISKVIENTTKQEDNDVIFEFKNERLLQGRDKYKSTDKRIAEKAISAVFKMLKQNLSSDNNNFDLKSSNDISLDNKYFDIKNNSTVYKNILAFLPLTGSYSNYGVKIRKALDLSVLNYSNDQIKITYFNTAKNIENKVITKLFNEINPALIIGPFKREVLVNIKPLAKKNSIPILTFSNDIAMIENNIWSLGFSPEEQVESVIKCALVHGYRNFGLVAPDNLYGSILTNASVDLISDNKMNKFDKILLSNDQINNKEILYSILKRFLQYNKKLTLHKKFDAIILGGSKEFILEIAPLLSFFNVDSKYVKILGTENFNHNDIKTEPSLEKSWFPIVKSKNEKKFELLWQEIWGDEVDYFSNAGFDSGTIGINFIKKEEEGFEFLEKATGPISGLIFNSNGYVKKPISVMQIENLGKLADIEKCNSFKG